jgi:2,4-dienoyl-CoA reductase-like NADH-dependent reductase (Old Yellow Enzyme family)
MHLRSTVEQYLKATGMPPTRFGREAVRDPRLVHDMRRGREIGPKLAARVIAFVERDQ